MSNFLQTLFNTNHDQPSFLVFVVLAFIAIVVPNLSKYLYESRRARNAPRATSSAASSGPKKKKKKKRGEFGLSMHKSPTTSAVGLLLLLPQGGS